MLLATKQQKKYLEEAKFSLKFQLLQPYIHISTFKFVLISLLVIKYFASLKNESSLFWMRVCFKVGFKFSKILRGVAFLGEGGQVKMGEVNISGRADTLEDTNFPFSFMAFQNSQNKCFSGDLRTNVSIINNVSKVLTTLSNIYDRQFSETS